MAKFLYGNFGTDIMNSYANNIKIIRSRAPLRIGLAGGGTDVSPFADLFGGAILNATVSLFATTTIKPTQDGKITLISRDLNKKAVYESQKVLPIDGELDLLKGVYNRVVKDYLDEPLSFEMITDVDVPKGSGMGSSSTITVSILGAFSEWFNLPLGEYDMARLAFDIERNDLALAGGRQDQYAATFGGFNFMEFYEDEKVIVNPLRIKLEYKEELEINLLLYYTGTSRESAKIIKSQSKNFSRKSDEVIAAAHALKQQAIEMKEALLTGNINELGHILEEGWQDKKRMAKGITNPDLDMLYEAAKRAGATGGKISGAGGGGFMMLYCPENSRYSVIDSLEDFPGNFVSYQFTTNGLRSWKL